MAAQTLETIPEETVAPAVAPAVTPATGRVTSDAPKQTKPATDKNPGRVASGKRLAERNRLAREAKKKAEAAATQSNTTTPTSGDTNTEESSSGTIVTILGIDGLVVFALGVYYQREAIMKRLKPAPAPAQPEQPAPTPAPSCIPVKRGIREMELKKKPIYTPCHGGHDTRSSCEACIRRVRCCGG